ALVQVTCGGNVVASGLTNAAGIFNILLNPLQFLLTSVLSSCQLVVATPLATCNASLPAGAILQAPLQFVGNTVLGLLNVVNLIPGIFQTIRFGTGRAVWHGSCSLARIVQFGTDRAVWHEPEHFSSELNNISLKLYTVQRSVQRDKEVNQAARDSDDALVCCVENTVEDRIMDSGALFHATYCNEELERFKLRSGKVRLADDKTLYIARVGDVVLKTSFGTSWTLKDVRYIPGLKRRLISVGQLDEEGYHIGFGEQ
nr:pollen Ole e 1 allergen and extensin family protein [Tanacetum cinerariifolium]